MNNDLNRYIKTLQYKLVRPWKPQCSNLGIHRHCPNNKTGHNPFCQHPWIQDQLVNAKTQMANNHMKLSDCTGMAKLHREDAAIMSQIESVVMDSDLFCCPGCV